MNEYNNPEITDELLARLSEGNVSKDELTKILASARADQELAECLDILSDTVLKPSQVSTVPRFLPVWQMAAANDSNTCSLDCEIFILRKHNMPANAMTLLRQAKINKWLHSEGTPLHNVGRILEVMGFSVIRKYDSAPEDIMVQLKKGSDIIVVTDKNILDSNDLGENTTYHAIAIERADLNTVSYYESDTQSTKEIPMDRFIMAWSATRCYMVYGHSDREYNPHPLELGDVRLPQGLESLTEAIAENAHDVWARARMDEGWTYGETRDDKNKKHPDLTDYYSLPDSEKNYDRIMAKNTLQMILSMGFDIVDRREDIECPDCGSWNAPEFRFCPKCGRKLI